MNLHPHEVSPHNSVSEGPSGSLPHNESKSPGRGIALSGGLHRQDFETAKKFFLEVLAESDGKPHILVAAHRESLKRAAMILEQKLNSDFDPSVKQPVRQLTATDFDYGCLLLRVYLLASNYDGIDRVQRQLVEFLEHKSDDITGPQVIEAQARISEAEVFWESRYGALTQLLEKMGIDIQSASWRNLPYLDRNVALELGFEALHQIESELAEGKRTHVLAEYRSKAFVALKEAASFVQLHEASVELQPPRNVNINCKYCPENIADSKFLTGVCIGLMHLYRNSADLNSAFAFAQNGSLLYLDSVQFQRSRNDNLVSTERMNQIGISLFDELSALTRALTVHNELIREPSAPGQIARRISVAQAGAVLMDLRAQVNAAINY